MILSLDGGGIRGAATARFLSRIDETLRRQHKTNIRNCVDLFAGTSTGSIIALGLAARKLSMRQIDGLYSVANAKVIFAENTGWFEIDGVNAPKYEGGGKTTLLKRKLGTRTTVDSVEPGKHILVVSYSVEKRVPLVIKSTEPAHHGLLAYEVADASSAAPTYFPTVPVEIPTGSGDDQWLIDGGVVANNPTVCAISEVRKAWPEVKMDDVRVLSVGTGSMTRKINGPDSRSWGSIGWFAQGHILDVLTDERIVAYQAKNILSDGHYIRVNAELRRQPGINNPPDDAMDDISESNIKKLRAMGDFWFEKYGQHAVTLLLDKYSGPSLDRIDPETGNPR